MARIASIASYLPAGILDNDALAAQFPEWPSQRIEEKTGIVRRHIAATDEFTTDLAQRACEALFTQGACRPGDIDYVLVCTQTPEQLFPSTATVLQQRLGLSQRVGALDFNQGCSGYVYGLGLAEALIASGQAERVLLVTADTYSKLLRTSDKNVRTLFGDAATATLVVKSETAMGPFIYGTDGEGAAHLCHAGGGVRGIVQPTEEWLHMNGPEVFNFTLRVVPNSIPELLKKAGLHFSDVDHFVFHQANGYMLEHLRRKLDIPSEKFAVHMRNVGNTVSSSIPLALQGLQVAGRLKTNDRIILAGFGVGLSWATALIPWASI
jgi:3-oxoacyl-[acyl-carrier-protein] synthase-3